MKIINNIRFIQQIEKGCCPASINIVLDYYFKDIRLNQELILCEFSKYKEGSYFSIAEKYFSNHKDYNDKFIFRELNTNSKEDWIDNVKTYINKNVPVIISTKTSKDSEDKNYHITVIFGYIDDILFEICPTLGFKSITITDKLVNYDSGGTDLLIIEER